MAEIDVKTFTSGEALPQSDHYVCSSFIQPYKCKNCSFKSYDKLQTNRHICENPNIPLKLEPWFSCFLCDFKCFRRWDFRHHFVTVHSTSDFFRCIFCPFMTKSLNSLELHTENSHICDDRVKWFHCDKCDFNTKVKRSVSKHLKRVHYLKCGTSRKKKFKCDLCCFASYTFKLLQDHVKEDHPNLVDCRCKLCGFMAITRKVLKAHMEYEHNSDNLDKYCQCDKYTSLHSTVKHLKRHKSGKRFKCGKCGSESNIKFHKKKHEKSELVCKQCGYNTLFRWTLKRHIKSRHSKLENSRKIKV